ncbi:hypothetical protein [Agriterribacter sp.]|uniref:hypothetical protein n=1 Tax=Agriterribacter sp. TaxID=2821509 RepID=UPI002B7670B9|nr:hypothetical protein [Agriterribacter sp.]HRO44224.1 hypothetical protein [Agriterribacter sp.]HRQ18845.1 hypothetical protein [Agriterribacter sp.]
MLGELYTPWPAYRQVDNPIEAKRSSKPSTKKYKSDSAIVRLPTAGRQASTLKNYYALFRSVQGHVMMFMKDLLSAGGKAE